MLLSRLNRRELLSTALAIRATPRRYDYEYVTLARAGAAHGRKFGSAMRAQSLFNGPLSSLVAQQCDTLTPELELKWSAIEPVRGSFAPADADRIFAFADQSRLKVRGHTLMWHMAIPSWALDEMRVAPNWASIQHYFEYVIGRYGRSIDTWDVVNEPIDLLSRRSDHLRESPFLNAFGAAYITNAFRLAHRFAPNAGLFLNEYGLEYATTEAAARRQALLKLIVSLRERQVPVHGLGLQTHLDLGKGPFTPKVYIDFLREVSSLGLRLQITELDVKEFDYTLPAERRDTLVAEHVRQVLGAALSTGAIEAVTCWGLSDLQSWLKVETADYDRFPGAWRDGSNPGLNRGLPYDSNLRAKPLRAAIASALLTG